MSIRRTNTWRLCGNAACCLLMVAPVGALAETAASDDSTQGLAEIIVTAEKRSENINDVGMSITAVSGDQLAKLGVTDVSDLAKIVPGFTYTDSVYSTPVYTLRGIGFNDYSMGTEPAVSVYVDEVPLPYSIMTKGAALDLERLEVLKGPQGTLFGENSTGGAINFIAAKPTDTFHAGADVSYGRFNDITLGGFVSGPLSDTVLGRFAVSHQSADGWQYSTTRDDTNGAKDFTDMRLLLDWNPSSSLRFKLNLNGWHDTGDGQAAQFERFQPKDPANPFTQFIYNAILAEPVAPNNDRAADWQPGFDFARHDSFYQAALRTEWDVSDAATLTSITAYSHLNAHDPIDTDGTTICNFCWTQQNGMLSSLSEELRLAGTSGRLKWMVGGNYQDEIANQTDYALLNSTGTTIPLGPAGTYYIDYIRNTVNQEPKTDSGFGSLDFELNDQLTFQGSARYSKQHRTMNGCLADAGPGPYGVRIGIPLGILSSILSGSPTTIAEGQCVTLDSVTNKPELVTASKDESNVSWRAGLNWKPQPDTLLYVNAAKGFKAGGYTFTGGNSSAEFAQGVAQESVLAYEVGVKQSWLQNRIQLTSAVFYYDYVNKQFLGVDSYPIFGNLPTLINIPKSYVDGAEVNLSVRPVTGLTLSAGATYVHSKVQSNPNSPTLDGFGNPVSYVGESFPNTPLWQIAADAEYDFPLSANLSGMVGGTLSTRSASQSVFGDNPAFDVNSYALLDLRAGVQSDDGHWRAWVWGRNVTDKYYWTNVTFLVDTLDRLAGQPATFGVSASFRY
jgi:iron complex outermembrane recepter protein